MSERQKRKLVQSKESKALKKRMIDKVLLNSRVSNVAFDLSLIADGWLELESDPGTFTLLIEDFGCFGAQVDEIYDLEQKFEGPVFGFIFLFKWLNNQQNDRLRNQKTTTLPSSMNSCTTMAASEGGSGFTNDKCNSNQIDQKPGWSYVEDENIISEIFFAKQMISNSCATHALISILLNCDHDRLHLGSTLTRLKEHTKILNPENRGYAIGNLPELAKAHNSHASYSSRYNRKTQSQSSGSSYYLSGNQRTNMQQQKHQEAYHFVSYVPINNRLYELDGLKNFPIDHGPINPGEDWTEKFRSVIKERLSVNKSSSNDIRYNLMAVVPDKRISLRSRLGTLRENHRVIQTSIQRLYKPTPINIDIPNPPYSPLSNGTLTASESGSTCNSPTHSDPQDQDDEDKVDFVDRYFLIKFSKNDSNFEDGTNECVAHKSCVVNVEATDVKPLDMTREVLLNAKPEVKSIKDRPIDDHAEPGREKVQCREDDNTDSTEEKHLLEQNGKDENTDDGIANEQVAHSNEKYNLSGEPPFDFNILDDMQHVHFAKTSLLDMKLLSERLTLGIKSVEYLLKEEVDKRRKFKLDKSRRIFDYEPFIMTFLSMLAKKGNLAGLIEKDLGLIADSSLPTQTQAPISAHAPTPKLNSNFTPPTNSNQKLVHKPGPKHWRHSQAKIVDHRLKPKPKYKYVSTGRPVGRPRKNPLIPPDSDKKPH